MVQFLSFFKITNARIPHERGAPHKRGARLRQIDPVGLRPALFETVLIAAICGAVHVQMFCVIKRSILRNTV
jgi:hypothetical protein